ncbi:gamma-tubulin complex component 6-like isoform X2 [Dreissena polymorpha]|uniref:gamma-tubulin complex component 6-like isoform X2 n=1 Tax=Dreissena polymorpha TaxID=45954 RepID=UPI002265075C|nr:gamma-tubulin complex component 6-like isoform X2 [Dreissena polymorpha]
MGFDPELPDGPLNYGDTQLLQSSRFHYMHYSRSLFEAEPMEITSHINNLCDMSPGSGLHGNGLFLVQGCLGDQHEQNTTLSLFGGLVQSRTSHMDVRLTLPELPEAESRMLETRIPKAYSSYSIEQVDEGFKSQEESVASSPHSPDDPWADLSLDSAFQADYDTSVYDRCLTEQVSLHYTWETIGLGPGPRTKPFLMHGGPRAFDHWYGHMTQSLRTAFPSMKITERHEISQAELVNEILNVLIAVPSVNFMIDLTDQCFIQREGLYVSGVSPEGLQSLLEDFLACGMYYHRLGVFSMAPEINSFYKAGLTFLAFTDAVQMVLQYYRGVILSVDRCKTLLQLRVTLQNVFQEIRFLACLCHCLDPVTDETKDQYPKGIQLLSYLYDQTLEASFTDHYPVMLALLKHACTPYLIFVQEWVYHGVYRDAYGEFLTQVNDDYLQFKDKHYWTHGYTLATDRIDDSVPLFLRDLARDIFVCGKSINLLKACNRQHFFCDIEDQYIPRMQLTFSEMELRVTRDQCAAYASRMTQIAAQASLSRKERKERLERAKHDLVVTARKAAAAELKRLEDKIKQRKKAVADKKKKELSFLKNQMVEDLQRRKQGKTDQKAEDKTYMDGVVNRELAMDERQLELERQAREELVRQYSQLSEDAARREQKALWRVRRSRLDRERTDFLLEQDAMWAQEMEKYRLDPSSASEVGLPPVRPASPVPLPRWAERGIQGNTIQVVGEEESGDTGVPGDLLEATDGDLPNWARKGLEKYAIRSPSPTKGLQLRSPSPVMGKKTRRSLNTSFHVSDESEESIQKPAIQVFTHMHASKESSEETTSSKPATKAVSNQHASKETEPEPDARPHIKSVGDQHISQQSSGQPDIRPHIRSFGDRHANTRSDKPEYDAVPRMKLGVMHSGTESQPMEWKIKKQSVFGHVSQLSEQHDFFLPKLKKSTMFSASKESDWNVDYHIKPKIRINRLQTANTESVETDDVPRRAIKMSDKMSATKESEHVDHDAKRLKIFKERNIHGHTADSSVQQLLYVGMFGKTLKEVEHGPEVKVVPPLEKIEWLTREVTPYQDNFNFLGNPPQVNLLSHLPDVQYGSYGNYVGNHGDIAGYLYLPLSAILRCSVTSALEMQVSLVNKSLVDYFLSDLQIEDHFLALRRYLCMGDGDFSEILCDLLMEKLGTNPRPRDLINPMFLNNCLNKAVRLSVNAEDKYADNVSFILKYLPRVMEQTAPDVFDCIQLHYEVGWPLNIVITENSLDKYCQVFSFMLQLKRVVWVLKDVWNRLKRDGLVHKLAQVFEFRELHLYRQEMQLFVKVMQEYISHQVINVTWQEFQTALATTVHSLDDLHAAHNTYLDNALFRCLLTKNAASLMKIIQDTFRLILMFHGQLSAGGWVVNKQGVQTHRNYAKMKHSYKGFHDHSRFLFTVVSKLADRGYQPHLHDLLLRLNFNHYYDQ